MKEEVITNGASNTITSGYTSPFKGVLSYTFYMGEGDTNILQFMHEGMCKLNERLEYETNLVEWHDGVELTAEDTAYAWYLIADSNYHGSRFSKEAIIKSIHTNLVSGKRSNC